MTNCERTCAGADGRPRPLVGTAERGKKRRPLRIEVAIRRQTDEERRRYRIAVRALLGELVVQNMDCGKERNG